MGVEERLVTLAEVQTKIMFEAMNRMPWSRRPRSAPACRRLNARKP
ncbi:hypothetical protein ACPCBC_01695 [Streptomyces incarnatus]|nr:MULTISPECIES: hypothetical protein [Streptomyces]